MIHLLPLTDHFTIYQLAANTPLPAIPETSFYSVTRTDEEISIITNYPLQLENAKVNRNWKGFKVAGPLDFSLVGILYSITKPLKENHISVFVISTFDTDYIFVKEDSFDRAIEIFQTTNNISINVN